MIRRDVTAKDGMLAGWIIIDQIDHAHLALQLAEHWDAADFAPLQPRKELLWAIEHHDDGWREWDSHPQVDAKTGVPRQFLEMQPEETREIWSRSIDSAGERGPLEGFLVAGHFCRLGRRSAASHENDPHLRPLVELLDHYEQQSAVWLAAWHSQDPATNTEVLATSALDLLQFFDTFSLWFCCSELGDAPEIVETPGGADLQLIPRGSSRVSIVPWPWKVPSLEVSVGGCFIPKQHYTNAAELASANSHHLTLRWKLTPP